MLRCWLDSFCPLHTVYWEIFALLKFCKNGNFNNFANDPRVHNKRCGMAILSCNLILQVSKICEIHENLAT